MLMFTSNTLLGIDHHTVSRFLTHFSLMSHFYSPWKRQKTYGLILRYYIDQLGLYNISVLNHSFTNIEKYAS